MSSSKQIKLGAIISYISIGINIIFGLVYTPWMIHSIGKDNFGLYILAISVISIFVFDFGLSQAIQRFVAKYLAENKPEQANNCLGLVAKLYLWIDILLLLTLTIIYFFIPSIYQELTPEEIDKFKIVYCIAAIFSVISFPFIPVNGILNANEKFIQLKSCELAHKFIKVGLMTICLLLGYGLYALVLVNALSGILTIMLKLYFIKHNTSTKINFKYKDSLEFKHVLSYSGWITVIALAQRMIFNIAPTLLGLFSGSSSIAVLGISITIEGYIYTFAGAINGLFLPKVTRKITAGENILPLMIKVGRVQIITIGMIIFGFICIGENFIDLWVGNSFAEAYLGAILLIIPSLFHSPQEIAEQTLVVVDKIKLKAIIFIFVAALNIALIFCLAPKYGMIGICIAICISYFIRTIALDFVYYKELHISIATFFHESFVKMSLPLLLALSLGLITNRIVPLQDWIGISIKGILFVIEYCAIIYILAMTTDEKNLFVNPVIKLYRKILKS